MQGRRWKVGAGQAPILQLRPRCDLAAELRPLACLGMLRRKKIDDWTTTLNEIQLPVTQGTSCARWTMQPAQRSARLIASLAGYDPSAVLQAAMQRGMSSGARRRGALMTMRWRLCGRPRPHPNNPRPGHATAGARSTYNVPEGHHASDLSSTACHIGLGRRRDLTMRQDLKLWKGDADMTMGDIFGVGARAPPSLRA